MIIIDARVELPDSINSDMQQYLDAISKELDVDLDPFGLKGPCVLDVVTVLRQVY